MRDTLMKLVNAGMLWALRLTDAVYTGHSRLAEVFQTPRVTCLSVRVDSPSTYWLACLLYRGT